MKLDEGCLYGKILGFSSKRITFMDFSRIARKLKAARNLTTTYKTVRTL